VNVDLVGPVAGLAREVIAADDVGHFSLLALSCEELSAPRMPPARSRAAPRQ
jgi:hypothetical protein